MGKGKFVVMYDHFTQGCDDFSGGIKQEQKVLKGTTKDLAMAEAKEFIQNSLEKQWYRGNPIFAKIWDISK